jgi:leucyl-tRNA synthetase
VTTETEELRYNTAIAAMMEFVNGVQKWDTKPRAALEPFLLLLAPYAPHLAEELWAGLGHGSSTAYEAWPLHDESLLVLDSINLAVQVGAPVGPARGEGRRAGERRVTRACLPAGSSPGPPPR